MIFRNNSIVLEERRNSLNDKLSKKERKEKRRERRERKEKRRQERSGGSSEDKESRKKKKSKPPLPPSSDTHEAENSYLEVPHYALHTENPQQSLELDLTTTVDTVNSLSLSETSLNPEDDTTNFEPVDDFWGDQEEGETNVTDAEAPIDPPEDYSDNNTNQLESGNQCPSVEEPLEEVSSDNPDYRETTPQINMEEAPPSEISPAQDTECEPVPEVEREPPILFKDDLDVSRYVTNKESCGVSVDVVSDCDISSLPNISSSIPTCEDLLHETPINISLSVDSFNNLSIYNASVNSFNSSASNSFSNQSSLISSCSSISSLNDLPQSCEKLCLDDLSDSNNNLSKINSAKCSPANSNGTPEINVEDDTSGTELVVGATPLFVESSSTSDYLSIKLVSDEKPVMRKDLARNIEDFLRRTSSVERQKRSSYTTKSSVSESYDADDASRSRSLGPECSDSKGGNSFVQDENERNVHSFPSENASYEHLTKKERVTGPAHGDSWQSPSKHRKILKDREVLEKQQHSSILSTGPQCTHKTAVSNVYNSRRGSVPSNDVAASPPTRMTSSQHPNMQPPPVRQIGVVQYPRPRYPANMRPMHEPPNFASPNDGKKFSSEERMRLPKPPTGTNEQYPSNCVNEFNVIKPFRHEAPPPYSMAATHEPRQQFYRATVPPYHAVNGHGPSGWPRQVMNRAAGPSNYNNQDHNGSFRPYGPHPNIRPEQTGFLNSRPSCGAVRNPYPDASGVRPMIQPVSLNFDAYGRPLGPWVYPNYRMMAPYAQGDHSQQMYSCNGDGKTMQANPLPNAKPNNNIGPDSDNSTEFHTSKKAPKKPPRSRQSSDESLNCKNNVEDNSVFLDPNGGVMINPKEKVTETKFYIHPPEYYGRSSREETPDDISDCQGSSVDCESLDMPHSSDRSPYPTSHDSSASSLCRSSTASSTMSFGSSYYMLYVVDPIDRPKTPEEHLSSPETSPTPDDNYETTKLLDRSDSSSSVCSFRTITPDAEYFDDNDRAFRKLRGLSHTSSGGSLNRNISRSNSSGSGNTLKGSNQSIDRLSPMQLESDDSSSRLMNKTPHRSSSQPASPISKLPNLSRACSLESLSSFLRRVPRAPSSFGSLSTLDLAAPSLTNSSNPSFALTLDRPPSTDSPILFSRADGSSRGSQDSLVIYRPVPRYNSDGQSASPEPLPAILCFLAPARPHEPPVVFPDILIEVSAFINVF